MSTTNDPTQNSGNPASENEEQQLENTLKSTNKEGSNDSEEEKEKHSTPVIPYTGNDMLQGGRSRLTASGDKLE